MNASFVRRTALACIVALLALPACRTREAAPEMTPAPALQLQTLAEKTVDMLPEGPLYWRVETAPSRAAADAAAGPWSLVAEAVGRTWLLTLGPAGGASPGMTHVADVGPLPPVDAPRYLLRLNHATGIKGSVTPVHTHAGSETFMVLAGEQSIRTPHGTQRIEAGHPEAGHGAGMPMQVSSSGDAELSSLVMFVVDATQPFSTPAAFADSGT
jgi:hypothetical protein